MGVLKAADVGRFVRQPDPAVKAVLIYGPDAGAVGETARNIVMAVAGSLDDPFNVIRLNDDVLSDDPQRLADEAQAISMMGGRRAVWISGAAAGFQKSVTAYLDAADTDTLIVAEAGDLAKSSKLRSLFEKAGNAYALPCYLDTRESLNALVTRTMADNKLEIAPDALHRLIDILGSDRATTRSELEKLVLYCKHQTSVSIDDVDAACGDTAEHTIDDMIDAAFSGDAAAACRHFSRLADAGTTVTRLLTMTAQHVVRLQHLALAVEAGGNAGAAVKAARPPIFFRRQPAVTRQLSLWRLPALEGAEQTIHQAIAQTRNFPALEPQIAERALLSLARNAQAARAKSY